MHKVGVPFPALSETARAVLVDLLVHGPASRADLARRAGLSPASLTRIIRTLADAGVVSESDAVSPQRMGRPSQPMDVNLDSAHFIGIKVSADRLNLMSTDMRARPLQERVVPLTGTDPESVVATVADCVADLSGADPLISALGISLAGPVSPRTETIRISPFLGWRDVPFLAMVREATGLPVVAENDVRALTAAEHWFGAAAGCTDFVLVTIGAGVGCGIVVNDRLVDGTDGGSGQIGHLPVSDWGPLCERGHRGCVRSFLSSSSIAAQVSAALDRRVGFEDVLDLAERSHPVARRVVSDACRALGMLIGTLVAVTAPSKVIVSGEGVGLAALDLDAVRTRAGEVRHWTAAEVPIELAPFTFGEWARGAAVIALRHQIDTAVRLEG